MTLSFGEATRVTLLELVSFVARRQARLCWQLTGGLDGDHASVDTLLADRDVRWSVVCDERGAPVADLWQLPEGALVFRAGTTDVIGQAVEHGFVCSDLDLRSALAAAQDAPGHIDFTVDAEAVQDLWSDSMPDTLREVA